MSTDDLEPAPVRVLLVEDNDDDAALLERHLRRSGLIASTVRAETAAEMLGVLRGQSLPDVVLADYNLPTFSGPEALRLLKSLGLDLPFIMLSGEVSEETAVASMRAGAHDYVSKQNLSRLVPAIQRELKEASTRRERLAAEVALRKSESRFDSLVEAMPLGLLISDADGRVTYANRAAERLLHYEDSSLTADSVTLSSICGALIDVHTSLANGSISTEPFEAVCTARDGTLVEVLIGIAFLNPEADSEERQLAAFIADLTFQKKSEEVLRRTEKLAVVGRLAASIAHEINNPLEATINCLYLMSISDLSDEARGYLDMAQRELDRVTQITVQTLRFYRASTRPIRTDIHELIGTVLQLLDLRIRQLQIEIVRDFRADPMIFVHDGEVRQVLANLIGNAIDAVLQGGRIVVRTSNTHDWKSGREGMVITVADNGVGMDSATRMRIFEPFFSTKGVTGTGLGLWVSHELVTKHDGHIRLRSRARSQDGLGGTVFRLFLPARDGEL